MMFFFFRSPR